MSLKENGSELLFLGEGGQFFIGPENERWNLATLVRQTNLDSFVAFASHPTYLEGLGRRTAAITDSRLLPLVER